MRNREKAQRCVACVCALLLVCGCEKASDKRAAEDSPQSQSADEAIQGSDQTPTKRIPQPGMTLELTGSALGKPTVFTFEQLARMEMTQLDNVLMQKSHEPDKMTSWRGPSLDALLKAAQLKPGPVSVSLRAADGYGRRCRLEQLNSAIVAVQDGEGRWLYEADPSCILRLVPPHKTGDFWIMNLTRIIVEPATGSQPSE